ncbi:PREDICTED: radial spoke head protein 3 homolog B [Dufourea novaeangliae]|uniref:Radial spoke head protein 3 like protein n=1 Tax=Dufourea novaeangliae TaxID=178035 RepID=A0A154PS47_DUFNO|nr:PREDICTED: radial spoke head protein 3 homolog B [Dufourea novaeangliae]KZC14729.1 Radial spoke head protein 3 like protein [Dufourea novaeangliae]
MPAEISALPPTANGDPFARDRKDPPAFTILQKDGLDSNLPLLHVNGDDVDTNGSEVRRYENCNNNLIDRKRLSRSNDHLIQASLQSSHANPLKKKTISRSQDSLQSLEKVPTIKPSITLSTEDFNEVLNAKLKRIQDQEKEEQRRIARKNQTFHKKPFITTVKTGEFLMPPPEVAALLGIGPTSNDSEEMDNCPLRSRFKSLVSLAKKPEVRHSNHNARCPAALKATVDFTLGMMNATTIAASTLDERAKIPKKNDVADQSIPFGNIMFDRRVVRGSTYAAAPTLIDGEQSIAARQAEARRRHLARKRAQAQATKALVLRIGSPPPVPGRKHEPVQTEVYLEELFDKPDEFDVSTQTDYFLDRPSTPPYCAPKVGQDVGTQIEPGDLFDFDYEVQPILETLVGKTVEQALIEVLEEEEIAALKEQQRKFLELRAAEQAEARRLEEQERRIREEKDERLKQHEEAMKAQWETEERIAAATLLTGYIAELLPAVLEGLKMSGFLLDEIKADMEEGFVPWLMKEVKKEMGNMIESRELLMEIIKEILENRAETYRKLGEEYDATRKKSSMENVEDGGRDPNFVNYQPPVLENEDAI